MYTSFSFENYFDIAKARPAIPKIVPPTADTTAINGRVDAVMIPAAIAEVAKDDSVAPMIIPDIPKPAAPIKVEPILSLVMFYFLILIPGT